MKKLIAFAVALVVFAVNAGPLFENANTRWSIVRPPDADVVLNYAVQELQDALKKISGATFPVLAGYAPSANTIYVGIDKTLPPPGDEVVVNKMKDGALLLVGNEPRAALHAVYAFLQRELGVRWLWPGEDGEFMPSLATYTVPPDLDWRHTPSIKYRGFHCCGDLYKHEEFLVWMARNFSSTQRHSFSSADRQKLGFYSFVGAPEATLSPAKFDDLFREHPECYAEVGGKRIRDNVCLSSDLAVEKIAENMAEAIETTKKKGFPTDVLGFILPDNQNYCTCATCKERGSVSTRWFSFYNKIIAKLRPLYTNSVTYSTYAYQGYRDVPDGVIPDADFVEYCSHGRCTAHPLGSSPEACKDCAAELARIDEWMKLGIPMGHYSYIYDVYSWNGVFLPNYALINESIDQDVSRHFVTHIPEVGLSPKSGPDAVVDSIRNRLSEQFCAQKTWDASLTTEKWMDDMARTAFGPAAQHVCDYLNVMQCAWTNSVGHRTILLGGEKSVPAILKPEYRADAAAALAAAKRALDEAEQSGADVSRFRTNLNREEILFAQWTTLVDKNSGAYSAVYAPRLLTELDVTEGVTADNVLSNANGVASGVLARIAWVGATPDHVGTTADRIVVEFVGDPVASVKAFVVRVVSPEEQSETFRVGSEAIVDGVCRMILPVSSFRSAPKAGATWSVRVSCELADGAAAFPVDESATVDVYFINRSGVDRPLFYYWGREEVSVGSIPTLTASARDAGYALTVATNAAGLATVDPATKLFKIVATRKLGELPVTFRETVTNAVAAGAVAYFSSYWDMGIGDFFGVGDLFNTIGGSHDAASTAFRVTTYMLDDDYIRVPNDLYSTAKSAITPAYAFQPVHESGWTVCLREKGKYTTKDHGTNVTIYTDLPYLMYRRYGKGLIVVGGQSIGVNEYLLYENLQAYVAKLIEEESLPPGARDPVTVEIAPGEDVAAQLAASCAEWKKDRRKRIFVLGKGTHVLSGPLTLDWPLSVRGETGNSDDVVLDGAGGRFCGVLLAHTDAVLADLTVTGCKGLATNGSKGGGVCLTKGTVENCHITANVLTQHGSAGAGVWMSGGRLLNSVIDRNVDSAGGNPCGCGVHMEGGIAEGCLIAFNELAKASGNYGAALALTEYYGGGVYLKGDASLVNCTVYGNYARRTGGGVYADGSAARVVNCLIAGNSCDWATSELSPDFAPESASNQLDHCIVGGAAADHRAVCGVWAGLADPENGDFSLTANSSGWCGGTAAVPFECTTDLAGWPRVHDGVADIGCLACAAGTPDFGVGCDRRVAVVGSEVQLRALRADAVADEEIGWSVTAPDGTVAPLVGRAPALRFGQVGAYAVRLKVGSKIAERTDFLSVPQTNYVSQGATAAAYPYGTPETATADLQAAIDAATDGSTVMVCGTVVAANVRLDRDIAVVGLDAERSVVDGNRAGRVFDLNAPGARVENLKITNGMFKDGLYRQGGAGARIGFRGGTISRCRIDGNQPTDGTYYQYAGGVLMVGASGRLTHSVICNNMARNAHGGGVVLADGLMDNCLVYGNLARTAGATANGGGVYFFTNRGRARNCTIVANTSDNGSGGGVAFETIPVASQLVNCVIAENVAAAQTSENGKPDWSLASDSASGLRAIESAFVNCAFETCAVSGIGGVAVAAPFVSADRQDFHVLGTAACIDAGVSYADISDTDLDGRPRVSGKAPDIGCYELDQSDFAPSFAVSPAETLLGRPITLVPALFGAPEGIQLQCHWTLTGGNGCVCTGTGAPLEVTPERGGRFSVRLEVCNAATGEQIAVYERTDCLLVAAPVVYLTADIEHATPVEPFDTPATASTNLNELIDRHVIDGCQIRADAGTHLLRRTLELTRGVRISGAEKGETFLTCAPGFDNATRTFLLNHPDAVLERLTVCGAVGRKGDYSMWGPVCCIGDSGGTVRYCVISNNSVGTLYTKGTAIAMLSDRGRLSHCLIADNRVDFHGNISSYGAVAVRGGLMDNCLVRNNRVDGPAGLQVCGTARVFNCTVTGNVSTNYYKQNAAISGYISSANGLYVDGASLDYARCRVENCIFAGNIGAAGAYAPEYGGTADASRIAQVVTNCLFDFSDPHESVGISCVTADPRFVDPQKDNYRLLPDSPARRSGFVESWMPGFPDFDVDFGGLPRLSASSAIDLGCYESILTGLRILVR